MYEKYLMVAGKNGKYYGDALAALNQTIARLLMPSPKPMEQRLADLNAQVVEWIKQFKRSLDALKTQHEEALSLRASTQTVAQLKR